MVTLIIGRALQLYEEMESTGPAPNMFTYNSIIGVFAELGNLEVSIAQSRFDRARLL
jgi:hypothetical protein